MDMLLRVLPSAGILLRIQQEIGVLLAHAASNRPPHTASPVLCRRFCARALPKNARIAEEGAHRCGILAENLAARQHLDIVHVRVPLVLLIEFVRVCVPLLGFHSPQELCHLVLGVPLFQ
eukprot:3861547-Prorocentrum_lima.AAC.1